MKIDRDRTATADGNYKPDRTFRAPRHRIFVHIRINKIASFIIRVVILSNKYESENEHTGIKTRTLVNCFLDCRPPQ